MLDRNNTVFELASQAAARSDLKSSMYYWFRGGYPEQWVKSDDRFRELGLDQYIQAYVLRDVARPR